MNRSTKGIHAFAMSILSHESSSRSYVVSTSFPGFSLFLTQGSAAFFFSNLLPLDRPVSTFDKILLEDPPSVRIWSVCMWPAAPRVRPRGRKRENPGNEVNVVYGGVFSVTSPLTSNSINVFDCDSEMTRLQTWLGQPSLLAEVSHEEAKWEEGETSAGFWRVIWWSCGPDFWSKLIGF